MIGVVAHNLAKCGEVVSQIEFGIGLLVGIVVVATGTAVLTTVVTSVTATSVITFALLTLVALEATGTFLPAAGLAAGFLSCFFSEASFSSFLAFGLRWMDFFCFRYSSSVIPH